jgi:PAS domain S-box-containing protein
LRAGGTLQKGLKGEIMRDVTFPQFNKIFEKMINLVDEGILIVDAKQEDMPVIYANYGFSKITGYAAADVIGKNPRFLKGPETDSKTSNLIRECIKTKKNGTANILNYKKDGSVFWNHFSITPIMDEANNVTHWIGIQRDITPIMQMFQSNAKDESMIVTIRTINDIINNFLNSLVLLKQTMEESEGTDKRLLEEFNSEYNDFIQKLKLLSKVEKFKEKKIGNDFSVLDLE